MLRPFQTMILAAVAVVSAACYDSGPTAPQATPVSAAARNQVDGLAAPLPQVSCTVTDVDGDIEATVTWKGISPVRLILSNSSGTVSETIFTHSSHSGSLTLGPLSSVPTLAELDGKTLGARTPCTGP